MMTDYEKSLANYERMTFLACLADDPDGDEDDGLGAILGISRRNSSEPVDRITGSTPAPKKGAQTASDIIGGATEFFKALSPQAPAYAPAPTDSGTDDEDEGGTNWLLIGGVVVGVLALGGIAILVMKA